eukprot:jgi/Botrbrau1/5917/Bobra.0366s0091.2
MGAGQSTEQVGQKVYKLARTNGVAELQDLLRDIKRRGNGDIIASGVLEMQDLSGFTPLIVASLKGNVQCVNLLLQNGANVNHVGAKPDCSTALHEAVSRGYNKVVDLLLQYGASPFMENGRSLTAVDLAINLRSAALVRRLETRAPFYGLMMVKVPKYMGLGSEWKTRWCVVMPRLPNPHPGLQLADRAVRNLLVCYKGADQYMPVSKMWLDGAVARTEVGSRGPNVLQCALSLHTSHAPPAGAHITGDPSTGYTLHLRPADGSAQATQVLQRFMSLVNGGHQPPGPPVGSRPPTTGAATPSGETDEGLAKRLQQQYDAEAALYLLSNPGSTVPQIRPSPGGQHASGQGSGHPLGATLAGAPPSPIPATSPPRPSSQPLPLRFPEVNLTPPPSYGANPFVDFSPLGAALPAVPPSSPQRPHSTGSMLEVSSNYPAIDHPSAPQMPIDPSGALSLHSTVPAGPMPASGSQPGDNQSWLQNHPWAADAPTPFPSASAGTPSAPTRPSVISAPGTPQDDDDDDEGQCVVCLAAPATAGFLHGDSVHKCCCRECAVEVKNSRHPTCPLCRQAIDHVILAIY